ncbi:SGNH/GDSL hydrolase family protein [Spirosoma arcticum]
MKLLAIGGCHTYGFGVSFEHGFVRQVALRLAQDHTDATIDYYAPLKLGRLKPLLHRLADQLPEYDLILLQPAHFELLHTRFQQLFEPVATLEPADAEAGHTLVIDQQAKPAAVHVFHQNLRQVGNERVDSQPPANRWADNLRNGIKQAVIRQAHQRGWVTRLNYITQVMADVLPQLEPVRNRVVFVSPMPGRDPFVCQLRRLVRDELRHQTERAEIAFVDSFAALHPHESVLLPDGCHLNSLGHAQLAEAVLSQCQQQGLIRSVEQATMPMLT